MSSANPRPYVLAAGYTLHEVLFVVVGVFVLAWVGTLVWALIKVVSWLTV